MKKDFNGLIKHKFWNDSVFPYFCQSLWRSKEKITVLGNRKSGNIHFYGQNTSKWILNTTVEHTTNFNVKYSSTSTEIKAFSFSKLSCRDLLTRACISGKSLKLLVRIIFKNTATKLTLFSYFYVKRTLIREN